MKSQIVTGYFLVSAIAFGILQPITLQAQTPDIKSESVKEDGLKVTKFATSYGDVMVNLPDDMSDSDTISGTVVVEPLGNTEEEKSNNFDTLSGYVVDIVPKKAPEKKASCQSNTDCAPFRLDIPDLCGAVDIILTRKIEGQPRATRPIIIASVGCAPKAPPMHLPPDKAILPGKGTCGKPMVVKGKCDGKFDNSAVYVSKKKCRMLAESPRQQVAESPKDQTGKLAIESVEGERRVSGIFENMPAPITYMTMRSPSAPAQKSLNLSGNWVILAKNDHGGQVVPTTLTQTGNQVTWSASGEGWSVSYRGILSGNTLDTSQVDNAGKFTGHGLLTYNESDGTLSGTLKFEFKNGPQGVTTDIILQRAK